MASELKRQLFHAGLGVTAIILTYVLKETFSYLLFGVILGGLIVMNLKTQNIKIPYLDYLVKKLERRNAPLPGFGSAWYLVGTLISITYLNNLNESLAVLSILAFGDSAATLIGVKGNIPLPYNKKKKFEGLIAFFLASLLGYVFIEERIIFPALASAIVESLPLDLDDNVLIPITATTVLLIL